MKRYLLFSYDGYYPDGGWNDFNGSFDTPELALAHASTDPSVHSDWWQLVDLETGEEVEGFPLGYTDWLKK